MNTTPTTESKPLRWWLLMASLIGLFCSVKLTLEKLSLLQQKVDGTLPTLGCDINPIVGCSSVIDSAPASIFGDLPNPLIGIVAFSAMGAIAVLLLANVRLPEWAWMGLQVGVIFGLAIVSYLQYESIYELRALCPYCMATWATVIVTFWAVTVRNLRTWLPRNPMAKIVYNFGPLWAVAHFALLFMLIWLQFGTKLWA